MEFPTQSSPYLPPSDGVNRLMVQVMLALIPGALCLFWFFGWGVVFNLIIATAVALAGEAMALKLRKKPVLPAIGDGSADIEEATGFLGDCLVEQLRACIGVIHVH